MQCYRMEGEIMNQRVGRSSIRLAQPVCVIAGASIVAVYYTHLTLPTKA